MNIFELFASLSLDKSKYDKGLADGEKQAASFGEKLKSSLGTAAKGVGIAIGAAASGVVALTTAATKGFADYEQLVGGTKKLFDKSADSVLKYAQKAYETAGLSATEYLEQATSFAASLTKSLKGDTEKAAQYADMAIRDMRDNASTMGTDIEMLQNAYGGFAKQNFTIKSIVCYVRKYIVNVREPYQGCTA